MRIFAAISRPVLNIASVGAVFLVAACSQPAPGPSGFHDPHEPRNRKVHAFNRGVDKAVLRPASGAYGSAIPKPVRTGVSNFSSNLGLPSAVLNNLLQADLRGAVHNTTRFFINSTVGLGGMFDPASGAEVYEVEADFGGTLAKWGFSEGAYVELPLAGPSTNRDAVGLLVDLVTDPVGQVLPKGEKYIATGTTVLDAMNSRYTFTDTVDSVLYESADSYAQLRLFYLQNRRFELGEDASADDTDPYFDPYEDPYE